MSSMATRSRCDAGLKVLTILLPALFLSVVFLYIALFSLSDAVAGYCLPATALIESSLTTTKEVNQQKRVSFFGSCDMIYHARRAISKVVFLLATGLQRCRNQHVPSINPESTAAFFLRHIGDAYPETGRRISESALFPLIILMAPLSSSAVVPPISFQRNPMCSHNAPTGPRPGGRRAITFYPIWRIR